MTQCDQHHQDLRIFSFTLFLRRFPTCFFLHISGPAALIQDCARFVAFFVMQAWGYSPSSSHFKTQRQVMV